MSQPLKTNRKRRIFLYVISIAITLFFFIPFFTSIEYSLLQLEKLFSVPGTKFVIGDAVVSKPENWLLSTSRKYTNSDVVFFGIFPEWIALKKTAAPMEPYYSFLVLDEYRVISQIDFLETPVAQNEKLISLLQNIKNDPSGYQNDPQRRLIKIKQWDALFLGPTKKNSPEFIYIPELKLSIRTADFALLENIDIQRISIN